jgi:hypothetical protein
MGPSLLGSLLGGENGRRCRFGDIFRAFHRSLDHGWRFNRNHELGSSLGGFRRFCFDLIAHVALILSICCDAQYRANQDNARLLLHRNITETRLTLIRQKSGLS